MSEPTFKLDIKEIKVEIQKAILECSQRGLMHSTKWLAEMNIALKDVKVDSNDLLSQSNNDILHYDDADLYILAKTYFDLKELDRCAFYTESSSSPRTRFLHLYSRYLSGERKKIHDMTDSALPPDPTQNTALRELAAELRKEHSARSLDAYCMYLYGVVLKRLELVREAQEVLVSAIHKEPLHWGAWLELAALVSDKEKASSLSLPNHWMKHFFLAHTYLEQQLNEAALDVYWMLQQNGFEKSTYITAQIAIAYHNRREVDAAIMTFRSLHKEDPYRLDNLDVYSNLLYVKEMRVELSHLAHHACEVDKYRVETCCVIGNYYSLRSEHQKAVLYFQRALKLNPQYLSAWTLMGHEFMEMKNTNAAIQSYRQAIEVNRRDYRAWYGLGQTYEILKMPFYCLFYYKQAQQLRPNDSRMLIALGETYEKLDKIQEALKCYFKARSVGDIEGIALIKMAKLYDKLLESEHAAAAYTEYVNDNETRQAGDKTEVSQAYKYLANYYLKRSQVEEAYQYAQKCLDYEETREEGKALLKTVAQTRNQSEREVMAGGISRGRLSEGHLIPPNSFTFSPPDGPAS